MITTLQTGGGEKATWYEGITLIIFNSPGEILYIFFQISNWKIVYIIILII